MFPMEENTETWRFNDSCLHWKGLRRLGVYQCRRKEKALLLHKDILSAKKELNFFLFLLRNSLSRSHILCKVINDLAIRVQTSVVQ